MQTVQNGMSILAPRRVSRGELEAVAQVPMLGWDAAFSLGDPAVATGILTTAGFASVGFAAVNEPVFYGPDVDAAYEAVTGLGFVKEALAGADAAVADAALQRLRVLLDAHRLRTVCSLLRARGSSPRIGRARVAA